MAAKMIRDGLLDSERVQKRSVPARWLFVTIMLIADDVGLFEISHFKLHRLAALDEKAIPALLDELAAADLIRPYKVKGKGKAYGFVPRYGQRLRVKRTKHPLPPEELMRDDDDAINKINGLTENPRTDDGTPPQSAATGGLNLNLNQKKEKDPSLRSGSAPPSDGGAPAKTKPKRVRPKKGDAPLPSVLAWNGYSAAYLRRYKVEPVRNARVNGQLAAFVARIPAAEVEAVAAFFVGHNGNLYVNAKHPVDLLLRDAEKLRTDWATNQRADPGRSTAAPTETAFQRQRRESVERMTGGMVSKPAPPTTKEIFDDVPDAPRIGH